ncbi:putative M18 family aminopeptidase 2 [Corynebacterium glaucum]|uniref:M18 family aminopeptidase n=1 Tax=Corynebacterium glaucum TaxID=187491 RepID=A0A1Q2HWL0_9CORY|nr:M18 family aminopeptidase [Corynebacterium glaucum]AQQ15247.1 putative M18 family aminopeptidase 2 [Corynebacterium glaucum]
MTQHLAEFIADSPSAYHAAANVRDALVAAGFAEDTATTPGGHVMVQGGAVMAWWVPENAQPRFRIIGSHTDSPGLVVKPGMDFEGEGFRQVAVEVYGGAVVEAWFDRELTFAGRISLDDGSVRLVSTGPVARVPHLAIHLYRGNPPELNRQTHLQPVLAEDRPLREIVAEAAGVDAQRIVAHELISADAQRPEVFGDLLAAGRLDNLSSVHASLNAMLAAVENGPESGDVLVLAAFNHEEIGSSTTEGAGGPLLERVLAKLVAEVPEMGDPLGVYAASSIISADAAHAVHPNYGHKHDPTHRPMMNRGPVLKVNANQRYATNAETQAIWRSAADAAGVPVQFFVGHNEVPCGSTIGPISSTRLGIPTVDVGIPLLSMHSARELAGVQDQLWFEQALTAYLSGA